MIVRKILQRSGSGREKEVDVAMTSDILDNLYNLESTKDVIFITVTGDGDLKIPIEKALDKGVPVELWSWDDAMARESDMTAMVHKLFETTQFTDTLLASVIFCQSRLNIKAK